MKQCLFYSFFNSQTKLNNKVKCYSHKRSKTNLRILIYFPYYIRSLIISSKKNEKIFESYCVKEILSFLTCFFRVCLFHSWLKQPYFRDQWDDHPCTTNHIVTRLRSLMDFTLRCVRFYPGVNSRAELATLAPGLRLERRFAPLARGLPVMFRLLLWGFFNEWKIQSNCTHDQTFRHSSLVFSSGVT